MRKPEADNISDPVPPVARKSAHVIAVANEKGGTGKSTVAVHVAVALLKAGQRVATIDLDARAQTFSHFIEDRRAWAKHRGVELEIPDHVCVAEAEGLRRDLNEDADLDTLIKAVAAVERNHDFLVIDTPSADSYLMRLALGMADTLIMPLNDSFVDFDVLGIVDPITYALIAPSTYTRMVCAERQERHKFDHGDIDWIVMRNRLSRARSGRPDRVAKALGELALQVGFRWADGLTERAIYGEILPHGLTLLDEVGEALLGKRHLRARENARQEVQALMAALKLPIDEKGRRHWAARAEWFAASGRPLKLDTLVG